MTILSSFFLKREVEDHKYIFDLDLRHLDILSSGQQCLPKVFTCFYLFLYAALVGERGGR